MGLATASSGGYVAWCVPLYKNSRPLWRFCELAVKPLVARGLAKINKSDLTVSFSNGGFLSIYSMDSADSILGEAFHLLIIDEAARIDAEIFHTQLEPTLADYDGDLIAITTPRGMNWYFSQWQAANLDGEHSAAWQLPTSENPMPTIQRAYVLAKDRTPAIKFQQEWDAQFVADGSGVFIGVSDAATATRQTAGDAEHEYAQGIDWGRHHDFTVIATYDMTLGQIVNIERFTGIEFERQLKRVRLSFERWKPRVMLCEKNSFGEPLIEQLKKEGLPVQAFTMSNVTKSELVDAFALKLENQDLQIIPDATLVGELQAYAGEVLPSGLWRYSAPSGMHDDTVIASMLAVFAGKRAPRPAMRVIVRGRGARGRHLQPQNLQPREQF